MANHDARKGRTNNFTDWLAFPGGELEGERTSARCPACLDALNHNRITSDARAQTLDVSPGVPSRARTLCFQCYRMQMEKNRALRTAGGLNTASEARFTTQLPFEPVDTPRLQMLKAQRLQARAQDDLAARRRRAQIAARHALKTTVATLDNEASRSVQQHRARALAFAIRAAELQLPESWLPFVVAQ